MSFASDKHQVLFIHTHRTGGTTVRKALKEADPAVRMIGQGHLTVDEVAGLDDPARNYWKFAAVREPRSWLLSLYRYVGWPLAGHRDQKLVSGMAFDTFLLWLVDVGLERDSTYRRQVDFASGVDCLYPYEKMVEAVPFLFQAAGLPLTPLGHELATPPGTYFWGPAVTRFVERHFAEDIWLHKRTMEAWT